jgi:hypothetical protein
MRKEKLTQAERIGRLEKVVAQLYLMNSMIQKELKTISDKLTKDD